ncbi:hypothetical protein BMR02_07605 [Methylococcaceae bacterium HT1]|uniref:nucleotidyl transferase AbiEii/AbiGii toxin family protein n=1 Tax=Bathymodiolus platifrons methanotrophic gill symbiont TaxID=113268 RepID=UPI0011CC277C|nr:nucleotidyl transferase AbiEii/AbiGii toxin family protein [Bathymodiolus platifrons methanotrophic gill symbiont]TXK99406.1 hypothetical protein BMR02_07605 [Methylococcaceae bacterium HT1]
MSTIGFKDAYRTTALIRFRDKPALDIHVIAPPALAILKLIAWKERRHQHSKDALDLVFLLTEYINADNIERVSAGSRYFCESLFWASQPKQAAKT